MEWKRSLGKLCFYLNDLVNGDVMNKLKNEGKRRKARKRLQTDSFCFAVGL